MQYTGNSIIATYPEDIISNIPKQVFEYSFNKNWMSITDLVNDASSKYLAKSFSHYVLFNTHVTIMANINRLVNYDLMLVFNEKNERVLTSELRKYIPRPKKEELEVSQLFEMMVEELLSANNIMLEEAKTNDLEDEYDAVYEIIDNLGEVDGNA